MPDLHVQCSATVIGAFCSIGSRVVLGHGKHPTDFLSTSPYFYFQELGYKSNSTPSMDQFWFIEPIRIGNDVWIGDGVFVKNGVTIGDGAIVAARSVVTKDVAPYTVVAGVPAKVIRHRFDQQTVEDLLALKWWNLPDDILREVPIDDMPNALRYLRHHHGGQKLDVAIERRFIDQVQ
jgi:acetyltransferase-like isoleucine patch superfamily enzyme